MKHLYVLAILFFLTAMQTINLDDLDVVDDDRITAADAVYVINRINQPYDASIDVNNDGFVN